MEERLSAASDVQPGAVRAGVGSSWLRSLRPVMDATLRRLPLRWLLEAFYLASADPWNYWKSSFETERYQRLVDVLQENLPPGWLEAGDVLEVGCSVGAFTQRLADLHPRSLTGLDISAVALRRARRALRGRPDVRLVLGDVFAGTAGTARTTGTPGPYHMIVASDVLGYTGDLPVLAGARDRLLASLVPGGFVLLANTRLRAHDGEGWEPFPSGFPRLGAACIRDCFLERTKRVGGYVEPRFQIDLLRRPS